MVIEAYAKCDCGKKQSPLPDFDTWDWSNADSIDASMCRSRLKVGIPAGYLLWDEVELTMADLMQCAVDVGIMPGQPRMLGDIPLVQLVCRPGKWHAHIIHGGTFDANSPMLLRRAVAAERPAKWYIEDGSGRAITFLAHRNLFAPEATLAVGYFGREPDRNSRFVRAKFPELLVTRESS